MLSFSSFLLRYNKLTDHGNFFVRILSDLPRYHRRKQKAEELLSSGHGMVSINPQEGYVITRADQIEGLMELIPLLQGFAARKLAEIDVPQLLKQRSLEGQPIKPFYFNIMTRTNLRAMPELVDFTVSDGILRVLVPYYGLLPELSHMAVFVSGFSDPFIPGSKALGTQCLHVDNHDLRHVKLFCFLSDVNELDGPLTLLPADKSAWLLRKTGRQWRTSPFRDDSEFLRYFDEKDLIRVTGPAGTVAIVDTTKCLHFGSRCQSNGRRTVFVIHYTLFAAYSHYYSADFEDLNMATSPEFRSRIANNERQALVYHLVNSQ